MQGRKSRYRDADDVERLMRAYQKEGIKYFMITDDNLARNRNWEAIFDRLIALRKEGIKGRFIIQVDTACHKIPGFIEKAAAAGVKRVFIGLENINPDNLIAAKKKQNHIADYRLMLQAWRKVRVITYCGYILGFPGDTPESIVRDVEVIKRELPLDILEFSVLTPLPGSEDHRNGVLAGMAMDPDLNKYDLEHVVADHPRMSRAEWQEAYKQAWLTYYNEEHVITVIRRAAASGFNVDTLLFLMVWFWASWKFYSIYPLESGLIRRRARRDRRPGMKIESALTFYPRNALHTITIHARLGAMLWRLFWIAQRIKRDPEARNYTDLALTPQGDGDVANLELFQLSESARQAGAKGQHTLRRSMRGRGRRRLAGELPSPLAGEGGRGPDEGFRRASSTAPYRHAPALFVPS